MYSFKIRYRYASGSWGETTTMARNNYEATQYAYAVFGQANVLAVWMDNY